MSHNVAMELIQNSSLGVHEVYYTAMYIHHTANYFKVMNSTSLDAQYMQKLMKFLVFILKWKREIDEDPRECCEKNSGFITKQTFKDLTRSIKGFINLVQYIKEHLPTFNIVPRTISQDDVENYFSLQRARKSGGDITVADFFAGNKALSTQIMLNSNYSKDQKLGNYNKIYLSPHSSINLTRRNMYRSITNKSLQDWNIDDVDMKNYNPPVLSDETLKPAMKRELLNQFHQSLSNLRLPRSHVTVKLEIVQRLKLKENREYVQHFLTRVDRHLIQNQFRGPWHKDKYKTFSDQHQAES